MDEKNLHFTYGENAEQRLDKFLTECLPEYSRSRIQNLIKNEYVKVNNKIITKTGYSLEKNDTINIHIPPIQPSEIIPESIPLNIVFENDDLILVNKPAGMVVHPSAGHSSGTLVHAALSHAPEMEGIGGEHRPGVVHRLDKNTSGLILLAKNDIAHRFLQDQFKQRKVKKNYLALVDGAPPTPTGRIEAPIGRDPSHRKKMAVLPPGKGKPSITEYFTRESYKKHTLVETNLITGRTHQIRLHLSFLNCPVVGDTIYGYKKPTLPITRHFLHAFRIEITLPGQTKSSVFETPLPDDLLSLLSSLNR